MLWKDCPTIVLAIDGLRAAALGAYGQTAYQTPAFDRLATESRVYEWCYAPTPDPIDLYRSLAEHDQSKLTLLTEAPSLTQPLESVGSSSIEIPAHTSQHPAESVSETATAKAWTVAAEQLALLADRLPENDVWIHLSGLYGPWDAPPELIESLLDETDPAIEACTTPPDEYIVEGDWGEARFAAACRYAAQVMVLDACLEGLVELIEGLYEGTDHRLVVMGLRGFPLGEHARIGGVDDRLYSEQQQVPLFVRSPSPQDRFTRVAPPIALGDALLAEDLESPASVIRLCSPVAVALRSEDWLLRTPIEDHEAAELYAKPDDRWEQNDVAKLEKDAADRLLAMLPGKNGVAATRDGQ